MKRIICLVITIIVAYGFNACSSNHSATSTAPVSSEDKKEVRVSDWKPVTVYDDFGEENGYSNYVIEYDTKCAYVGDDNSKKLSVVFDYVQQPDLQGFNIAIEADPSRGTFGYVIKDLRYKTDGEAYEILKFNGIGLWDNQYKEDVERIYNALIGGKDVAFSVEIKYQSSSYHKYAFTVSGYGFADAAYEYLE